MSAPQAQHFPGMIHFGYATGHFSKNRWDGFSPDARLPFSIEIEGLTRHLAIFGSSGSGKTDALIKPTVFQFLRAKRGGVFAVCGKGTLPSEFLGTRNHLCLDPTRHKVGLMEGMTPHQAVQTITEINVRPGDKGNKDPIWNNLTQAHLRHAAYFLEALVQLSRQVPTRSWFWTMWDWARVANLPQTDPKTLQDMVSIVRTQHPGASDGMLEQALNYFESDFNEMDEKLRSGALGQVQTWMGGILSHPQLLSWAKCESGVDPEICLRRDEKGEYWMVSVNLPQVRYDQAGTLATAFIKARVQTRIKERADAEGGWRVADPQACDVLMAQDEFQLIATESDYNLAPIARSLGCMMLVATQTIESVRSKAGDKDQVEAFYDAFQSRIALNTSVGTIKWLQEWQGFGMAWVPQFGGGGRTLNFVEGVASALRTPLFEENHPMRPWMRRLMRKGVGDFKAVGMDLVQSQAADAVSNFESATLPGRLKSWLGFNPAEGGKGESWKEEPVLRVADFMALTKPLGIAVASVLRAGVVRRDFIELVPPTKGIPEDLRDPDYQPLKQAA